MKCQFKEIYSTFSRCSHQDNLHPQIMRDDFWKKSCGLSAGVYGRQIASLFPLNSSQLYVADYLLIVIWPPTFSPVLYEQQCLHGNNSYSQCWQLVPGWDLQSPCLGEPVAVCQQPDHSPAQLHHRVVERVLFGERWEGWCQTSRQAQRAISPYGKQHQGLNYLQINIKQLEITPTAKIYSLYCITRYWVPQF